MPPACQTRQRKPDLDAFALAFNPEAVDPEARTRYAEAFASAGAMRAGFELYRAFDRDASDNRIALKTQGRLKVPVLTLAGEHSALTPAAEPTLAEVAKHATVQKIPAAGHWLAEENPTAVVEALVEFLNGKTA